MGTDNNTTEQTDQGAAKQEDPTEQNNQTGEDLDTDTRQEETGAPTPPEKEVECIVPETIEDSIKQREQNDKFNQIATANRKKLGECLKTSKDAIVKLKEECKKLIEDYKKEYNDLKCQKDKLQGLNSTRVSDIPETAAKNIKKLITTINDKIEELKSCKEKFAWVQMNADGECQDDNYECPEDFELIDLTCSAENLQALKSKIEAERDLASANKRMKQLEDEIQGLKTVHEKIKANFKKIEEYEKEIEKAQADGELCKVYTYILLINEIFDDTDVVDPVTLQDDLDEIRTQLECSQKDVCYKEYVKNMVYETYDLVNILYTEALKNKSTELLEKIGRIA
jgi:hypothetical protein